MSIAKNATEKSRLPNIFFEIETDSCKLVQWLWETTVNDFTF